MTSITGIVLTFSLIIIMFGMGLSLTLPDYKRIITYLKANFIGLFCQFVSLLLIGCFIAISLNLSATTAIRVMILAACLGGSASNMLTYLTKGDLALPVSLTAVSSFLSIISIPFIMQFAISGFTDISHPVKVDTFTINSTVGCRCLLIN